MGRGRLVDIDKTFDAAWNEAAAEYDYHHIESLALYDCGKSLLRDKSNPRSSLSIQHPEAAYLRRLRPASAGIYGDEQRLPRLGFDGAKVAGLPMGYHRVVLSNATPRMMPGRYQLWEQATRYSIHQRKRPQYHITSRDELDALTNANSLPSLPSERRWRSRISYYRRLWTVVLLINAIAIAVIVARSPNSFTYGTAATATGANLFVTAISRHEHCINIIFRLACALPLQTPLWIRRRAAKVYSYGGIHSGCATSALVWYIFYAILAARQFRGSYAEKTALAATTGLTLMLLTLIIITSHPHIRRCHHNKWEIIHRFGGWTAVALVWAQTLIIVITNARHTSQSVASTITATPTFYFLLTITFLLLYPWLRLRRRKITRSEALSPTPSACTSPTAPLLPCKGYRLATNPLLESHGFATIPNAPSAVAEKGYSILVSNAGDWTGTLIANPPPTIWTRGAPTTGVMRIATLFKPLVIVATGSGIGPCLSFLQPRPDWPVRIIWSCRTPETTYGGEILRAVLRADPEAVVVDTKETGHPDLPALAWAVRREVAAEAVVVISNPRVTGDVVGGWRGEVLPLSGRFLIREGRCGRGFLAGVMVDIESR